MSFDLKRMGKYIAHYRKAVDLTQTQLAKKLNVSRTTIANMELGVQETPLTRLAYLAELLNVPLTKIIDGELPLHIHRWETKCLLCKEIQCRDAE